MSTDRKTKLTAAVYAAAILTIVGYLLAGGARIGWWWLMTTAIVIAIGSGMALWNRTTWRPMHWRAGVIGGVALVVAVSEVIYRLLQP